MKLFVFDEEENIYTAKVDGVEFICDKATPELEEGISRLARAYRQKLPQIAEFMMDDVAEIFGELTQEELIDALGEPQVDLDRETISYLEHTLDDSHIIEVEYSGLFDELYEVIIDG